MGETRSRGGSGAFGGDAARELPRDSAPGGDIKYYHEPHAMETADGDLGCPASVQLDDGVILTVYYQKARAGEKTCLMGMRWKIK